MTNITWQVRAIDYMQKLGGKIRPLKHYRCGTCRGRKRLNMELWQYIRPPKCDYCHRVDWRMDLHRYKEWRTGTGVYNTCYCDGLPYPHRIAGSVWCSEHPIGPDEKDYISR